MSSVPSNPSNPDQVDEQLVAYLDGELEPEAAQRVEHLLAADEQARGRLSQLAASWDLLDQLPRATVDDLFTKTTVEMVAVAAEEELSRADAAAPAKRRRRWLEGVLATAVAAAIGFVLVAVALPNQNDMLLDDLPVIHDLNRYRAVDSIDYLKEYQQERLFPDDSLPRSTPDLAAAPNSAARQGAASKGPVPIPLSIAERRAWVEALSSTEKLTLRDNLEIFSKSSLKEQQSLRQVEEQLRGHPDLQRVMQRYYEWYEALGPTERNDIADETHAKDRVAKIKGLQHDQERTALRRLAQGRDPKDPDDAAVVHWMREFVDKYRELLQPADERRAATDPRPPDPRRPEGQRGSRGGGPANAQWLSLAYETWWSPTATKVAAVTDEELEALAEKLSDARKQEFAVASDMNLEVVLLRRWIQRAVRAAAMQFGGQMGRGRGGPQGFAFLEEFERQLTDEQRRQLQGLTENDRRAKLSEFFQQRFPRGGRAGGPGGMPFGPPGGPQGPPPERKSPPERDGPAPRPESS